MSPKWLVLLKNGIPVGVVHPSRQEQTINWRLANQKENREVVEVQELT
jgi:hypothetical protein